MKKYGTLLLSLMIFMLCSCNSKNGAEKSDTHSTGNIIEQPNDTVLSINDTIPLDCNVQGSPMLRINLTLTDLVLENDTAKQRAVGDIAYILLAGEENKSIVGTGNRYREILKMEYLRLHPDYINIKENYENPHWLNQEHTISSECRTGYKGIVNYIISFEEYTGGAHPNSYRIALNFAPDNGAEVSLDGIMKDGYEQPLLELIKASIMEFLNLQSPEELDKVLFDSKRLPITRNVVIGKDKLTFIYNKYDIAPYAVGEIIAEIPYDKLKGILK